MKTCNCCGETKPLDCFSRKSSSGYLSPACKPCRAQQEKERRARDSEKIRERDKARWWADKNGRRSKSLERMNQRYATIKADPELHAQEKARNRERAKRFPDKWRAMVAKRRATKLQATPAWLDADHLWMLEEIYELVRLRKQITGGEWHADHVVPLQGKTVSGLHVPWNLRVIPAAQNRSKGNRLPEL